MKDGLDNSGFGFGGDSTPEQTISLTTGQKITITNKEYTVIENVKGNKYKVLTNNLFQKEFDGNMIDINNSSNVYSTSDIATYLDNEYYNSLDESVKKAIVDTSIRQKLSSTAGEDNGGGNSPSWTGETRDAGTHKIFIPSWEEVTKVYGSTPDKLKAYTDSHQGAFIRDVYAFESFGVLLLYKTGELHLAASYDAWSIRPAFVIDLSKVEYTIK